MADAYYKQGLLPNRAGEQVRRERRFYEQLSRWQSRRERAKAMKRERADSQPEHSQPDSGESNDGR